MKISLRSEDDYEDLLGQWSNLQAALGVLLRHPQQAEEFSQRIEEYDQWMQDLLTQDADLALYLLFQLAGSTTVGYSASHALVCAVLCHLLAQDFELTAVERRALVQAALTMNVAMTALQDELAHQKDMPSTEQTQRITDHPEQSAALLQERGMDDLLLLETVRSHHQELPEHSLQALSAAQRLSHMLQVVDRYAAMISPRQTREGRSAQESIERALHQDAERGGRIGQSLLGLVGLFPPGTPVMLQDGSVGMVRQRGASAEQPEVALVVDHRGMRLSRPQRVKQPAIRSALAAAAVQERLSHYQILRLNH